MEHTLKQYLAARCPLPHWLRRFGVVGFTFYLVNGLLWLTVPGILTLLGR